MAQGLLKKPATNPSKKPTSTGITKKGARTIKPKNNKLQKQMKMNKKLTSGLTAQTERMLGQKAGHLELIGKGRDKNKGAVGDVKKGKAGGKKR